MSIAEQLFFSLSGRSVAILRGDSALDQYVPKHAAHKFLYKGATIVTAPITLLSFSAFAFLGFLSELTNAFICLCRQEKYWAEKSLKMSSNLLVYSLLAAVYSPLTPLVNLWNFIVTAINDCRTPSDASADIGLTCP